MIWGQPLPMWFPSVTHLHLYSSGFIHQQMVSAFPSWGAGDGLLSHGEVISHSLQIVTCIEGVGHGGCHIYGLLGLKMFPPPFPEHDEKEVWRMQNLSEVWGLSDGRSPLPPPQHTVGPNSLFEAAKPLEGKVDAMSCAKSHLCSSWAFTLHLNQMECSQRCRKMQNNQGELWPLSASKVEIIIDSDFVEVWADSSTVFHPHVHQSCTSASVTGAESVAVCSPSSGHGLPPNQACSSDSR